MSVLTGTGLRKYSPRPQYRAAPGAAQEDHAHPERREVTSRWWRFCEDPCVTSAEASAAYGRRSSEYIDLLGTIDATTSRDRDLIGSWAAAQAGPILDVGCGPGHWTNWLREQGVDVEGVDPTPEFLDHARKSFPDIRFREATAEDLGVGDAGLAGVLAWYSLIHTPPERIHHALAEFARTIRPGGGLLVGFFEGAEIEPFDHAVTTGYFWPVDELADAIEEAGFTVVASETRTDAGARPHGAITATRTPDRSNFARNSTPEPLAAP